MHWMKQMERNKMEQQDNNAQLMQQKLELLSTTATAGWQRIQRFAETVVRDLERKALSEEDDDKANGFRRDARGARTFKEELFRRIEIAKAFDDQPRTDNFVEVIMD
jgi:parvulin-like peptidyl-prolyl isomerase